MSECLIPTIRVRERRDSVQRSKRGIYDALGNRIKQTISGVVTQYLLDLQPGLSVVLAQTTSGNTDRYVHGPTGIHAQKDAAGNWEWMIQDGLGSVRGVASNPLAMLESRQYSPYGMPFGMTGANQTPFGFTGEPTDANTLLYLRARYYAPALGSFTARDHLDMVNLYSYVGGNAINDGVGELIVKLQIA